MAVRRAALASLIALVAACAGGDPAAPGSDEGAGPDAATDVQPDLYDASDAEADLEVEADADAADVLDVADDTSDADAVVPGPWRSALYPEDWTPATTDAEGRFLHDFSYAGYRLGAPGGPDAVALPEVVVAVEGLDPDGLTDATAAIQTALDEAAAASDAEARTVVELPAGLLRVDGTLTLTASHVVLRGQGPELTRLWFTKHDAMSYGAHLRIGAKPTLDDERPLAEDGAERGLDVRVADASGLAPGDDVAIGWVISDAWIADHGMTGTWQAFNGTWQPFFRRTIVAVDGDVVTLDVPLRHPALVRDEASLRVRSGGVREVGVESLAVANAVAHDDALAQDQVHAIQLLGVVDGWVRDVHSFPSPGAAPEKDGEAPHLQSSGILVEESKRVTVADCDLRRAQNRGGGGNGYLYEVRRSSEVLWRDCVARRGRHNFIQNWGFGATGIVWLRVDTADGAAVSGFGESLGASEFHHSLAMANLIDACVIDDAWGALNRKQESTGAGHTATGTVFWNATGAGLLRSYQFGLGYVIGTGPELEVRTEHEPPPPELEDQPEVWLMLAPWEGAEPEDWAEGIGASDTLEPASLYEDQLARRLGP